MWRGVVRACFFFLRGMGLGRGPGWRTNGGKGQTIVQATASMGGSTWNLKGVVRPWATLDAF